MSQVPRSLPHTVDSGSRWQDEKPLPNIPTLTTIQIEKSPGFVEQKQPWQPKSLRTTSLVAFIALYLVLLATLAFIWVLSRRTHGFTLISENHYIWMYGPTALLILIISLWRQVDYDCRILTPWQELEQLCRLRPARKALFLDYISPLQLIAMFQAIKHRHIPVIVTTLGFFTLKLVTIASTGLLSTNVVQSQISTSALEITRHFSYLQNTLLESPTTDNATSPFYQAYAHLQEQMPYHDGMVNDTVYQSIAFSPTDRYHNVTYSATVLGLSPRITCVVPDMAIDVALADDTTLWLDLTMWGSCTFKRNMVTINNPAFIRCPPSKLDWQYIMTDCGIPEDAYILLSYSQFLFSQELNATDAAKPYGRSVNASSSTWGNVGNYWLCKLEVDKRIVDVNYDTSYSPPKTTVDHRSAAPEGTFSEFQPANLSVEIWSAMNGADRMSPGSNPLIGLMENIVNATNETFLKSDDVSMGVAAERALHQIALQVIYGNAMNRSNTPAIGTLTYTESRLEVNDPSAIFMILGLSLMTILATVIFFKRPRCHELTAKGDAIATIAMIVGQSKECADLIDEVRLESEAVAGSHLASSSYSMGSPMRIDVHQTAQIIDRDVQKVSFPFAQSSPSWHWWDPITLKKPVIIFTMSAPVVLIVGLELIQRWSNNNKGFLALTTDGNVLLESVYVRFIPALVMLLVSTLFSALDFNAAILAPLVALKDGHACKPSIINSSALGKLPPLALYLAIKNFQWVAASAATAAFIGSVLTIVVSGLYTIELIQESYPVPCDRTDTFRTVWSNSSADDDGGAAIVLSLIENSNLTYPQFTYDELVFPGIDRPVAPSLHNESLASGILQMTVPALRGNLDCSPVSFPQANSTFWNNTKYLENQFDVRGSVPLPSSCLTNGEYNSSARLEFWSFWAIGQADNGTHYNGQLMDVTITDAEMTSGCPSLALTWGSHVPSTNVSFFTAYICNQQIQQLDVNLTLTYPGLTIPSSSAPVSVESSARLLPSDQHNATAFPFSIQQPMAKFAAFNRTYGSAAENLARDNQFSLDNFFSGVVTGQKPTDVRTLGDSTQDAQNRVMDGVQAFYRRYMAQVINLKMRALNDPSSGNTIMNRQNAMFVPDTGTPKIIQHQTSKLILQIMLGLMFVLGLVAVSTGTFHKIVPWNPCSIAGVAVLIAGSKICNNTRSQNSDSSHEFCSDKTHWDINEKTPLMEQDERFDKETPAQESNNSTHSVAASTTVPMWQSFSSHERARRRQQTQVKEIKPLDVKTARLRLGWWRDGEFMGDDGPNRKVYEVERVESNVRWRYGIDCIDL